MHDSDRDLLSRWRDGDNAAGSALIKRHFAALYRFFSSKAGGHGDDLVQQTFMTCLETMDAYRGESSFRAYLYGVARFQLYDHYRKVRRAAERDFTISSLCDLQTSPSGVPCEHEQLTVLLRALEEVPRQQRVALELTYWKGLSAKEVARVLRISENTVYSRLHRARQYLRQALDRRATAS